MTQAYDGSKYDGINHVENGDALSPEIEKTKTSASIMIPPELFEKLYLNPKPAVAGNLRSMIGNPTPM